MKTVTVVYVHVPNDEPHVVSAELYVKSVLQFPAGYTHRNLILSQFCMPTAKMQRLFNTLPNCSYYVHDDSGWDIGGFIAVAGVIKDDVMLCLGSSAQVRKTGWLARMMEAWEKHGPGLYGSLSSNQVRPHLNTTGFWCAPEMLLSYPNKVLTKEDRYDFEHGPGALWIRLHKAGKKVMLVTWCGEYAWNVWRNPPNISCRGNQENCLTYFRINYEYERCCQHDLQGRLNYEMLCDVPTTLELTVTAPSSRTAQHKWNQPDWIKHFIKQTRFADETNQPLRVLHLGCDQGLLVDALRQRGIDAWGSDNSALALSKAPEQIKAYCRLVKNGDLIDGRYGLIICERIDALSTESETQLLIADMCRKSDQILFCQPTDSSKTTEGHVRWVELFKQHGFFLDRHLDSTFGTHETMHFLRTQKQTLSVAAFSYQTSNQAVAALRLAGPLSFLEKQNRMRLHWCAVRDTKVKLDELLNADLFVLQSDFCGGISQPVIAAAREMEKPIVFELDELLVNVPKSHPNHSQSLAVTTSVSAMAREADFITVPTERLKQSLEKVEPKAIGKVHVLPNTINLDLWDGAPSPKEKSSSPFVIGWVGTKTHDADLALIQPVIAKLARKYVGRIVFKFWGYLPECLEGIQGVELMRGWQPDLRLHASEMINSHIDLALAPLVDGPFNQTASDIKWLEYSICYVPGIYSKIPLYMDSIKHGKTGWLVDNDSESWITAIEQLMNDHALRRSIAIQAHDEVKRLRSMAQGAKRWDDLYRSFQVSGRQPTPPVVPTVSTRQDRAAAHMLMYQADMFARKGEADQAQILYDQAVYRHVANDSTVSGFTQAAVNRYRAISNDLRVTSKHNAQMAAAAAVAEAGSKDRAVRLYLDAIVSLGKHSNPSLVFNALLNTARAFLALDRERGRNLLKIGAEIAQSMRSSESVEALEKLTKEYNHIPSRTGGKRSPANGERLEAAKISAPERVATKITAEIEDKAKGTPAVSIIVLVLNQLEHTQKCVDSLFAHAGPAIELILVDNGSTDGTAIYLDELRQQHANVRLITNATNRGFAAGNNQGLAIARGDHVVFLNNDTVVTAGWLGRMLAVFKCHPDAGVVGPMSNFVSGPQLITDGSYTDLADLSAFAKNWADKHDGQTFVVGRAVGFCLMTRREVIAHIGGLDERFGSGNFEDDDFCIRAHLAGYRIRIARDVFIHHTGNQTFKDAKIDYRQAMMRNWDLFRTKWKFSSEVTLERGYPYPQQLPGGVVLNIPLPTLNLTHQLSTDGRCWNELGNRKNLPPDVRQQERLTIHAVASVGDLARAQELLRKKSPRAAWESAREAIGLRPHHPEAFLLLAEIARMAGDAPGARSCAEHALALAPAFKPAKKFLKGNFQGNARPGWLVFPPQIENRKTKAKARLSVCLIVKNEERFIGQCLASIKDLADQIVVVDTGSTDRTVAIAREYGAEIHEFKWCDDFSAARNAALHHVTGDWILSLDADEELLPESREPFRRLLENEAVISWRLPLFDIGREKEGHNYVPRLFRNAPGLYFVGRVHEQVFYSVEARRIEWGLENRIGDATLRHHGYTKELIQERGKVERNLRLLEQAVTEITHDPLLFMNYGLELCRSDRVEEGLQQYRIAFDMMSQQPASTVTPETREALLTQYCTYLRVGKRPAEVLSILTSPLAQSGELTASQHFILGLAHMEQEQFPAAAQQMRHCLAKREMPTFTPINPDIRSVIPRHSIALCLWQATDFHGAQEAFAAAIAEAPDAIKVHVDFARFLHEQAQTPEALQLLNQFVTITPQAADVWVAGATITLSEPHLLEVAVDWTAVAVNHHSEHTTVLLQRAEALLLAGQLQDALPLWAKLAGTANPRVLAAKILCEIALGKDPKPPAASLIKAVNQDFDHWYWRLVKFGAEATILQLHTRVEVLENILPDAAQSVHRIIAKLALTEAV